MADIFSDQLHPLSLAEQAFLETTDATPERVGEFIVGDKRKVVESAGLVSFTDFDKDASVRVSQ